MNLYFTTNYSLKKDILKSIQKLRTLDFVSLSSSLSSKADSYPSFLKPIEWIEYLKESMKIHLNGFFVEKIATTIIPIPCLVIVTNLV